MPPRNCHVDQVPTERRVSNRAFFAQLLLIVQLRPSLVSWIMSDPISIVRKRWFDATPSGKEGVTERYVVFGESRKWLVEQLHLRQNGHVLDFGAGHGFLSFELASRTRSLVTAMDVLGGEQLRDALRGAQASGLSDRISWVVADGQESPFPEGVFDGVVSFLALQDISMRGGVDSLSNVLRELCRVLRHGGVILLADNMFPECVHDDSQKLYSILQRQELSAGLPSKSFVVDLLRSSGMTGVGEVEYDPGLRLDEKEAKVELLDIVEAKPVGKILDFETLWQRYGDEIRRIGLAYPRILAILGRR